MAVIFLAVIVVVLLFAVSMATKMGHTISDTGEAGRGFAVVADQIRQLAEQSIKSSATSEELSAQAISLDELISKFILPQD